MSDKTKIEWSDATWNPVTGCTKVSEGCRNCYAMTFAERWRGTPGHYFENGFDITLRPDKLSQPLKWKRPRKIFVNSMSDLFHEQVSGEFIAEVFAVMSLAPQHTFQVLTKRPERMRLILNSAIFWIQVNAHRFARCVPVLPGAGPVLLPNVWLGVSVENQKAADERIPLLLQTPAAVRFLSCEPLLGSVQIDYQIDGSMNTSMEYIDWVIVGGESGPGARPMHPDWARSIRDQCQDAGVSYFFKQWGEWLPFQHSGNGNCIAQADLTDADWKRKSVWLDEEKELGTIRVGKEKAGRLLDGRTWDEFPEVHHGTHDSSRVPGTAQ